jgi:hypothetical protein
MLALGALLPVCSRVCDVNMLIHLCGWLKRFTLATLHLVFNMVGVTRKGWNCFTVVLVLPVM